MFEPHYVIKIIKIPYHQIIQTVLLHREWGNDQVWFLHLMHDNHRIDASFHPFSDFRVKWTCPITCRNPAYTVSFWIESCYKMSVFRHIDGYSTNFNLCFKQDKSDFLILSIFQHTSGSHFRLIYLPIIFFVKIDNSDGADGQISKLNIQEPQVLFYIKSIQPWLGLFRLKLRLTIYFTMMLRFNDILTRRSHKSCSSTRKMAEVGLLLLKLSLFAGLVNAFIALNSIANPQEVQIVCFKSINCG